MPASLPRPEPLEDRVAPAQFFLSGTAFTAVDKDGNSVSDATLAGTTGAGLVLHLNKGDTVVLDTNDNHAVDTGETIYAKILAGKAILFATDIDGNTGVGDGDITGLAVGTGFNATITGSVHGSVVTAVAADGSFSATQLVPGNIAGLNVSGNVTGKLLAGGSIANVTIGTVAGAQSVKEIRAGSAVDGELVSYSGGAGTAQTLTPALAPGAAGASIGKVKLAVGADLIRAGDGLASSTGAGGKGGSISGITFTESPAAYEIIAGSGGSSTKVGSKGGAGGSVSGLNITSSQTGTPTNVSHIAAGGGGGGDTAGNGGSVTGSTLHFTSATSAYLYVSGGAGGAGLTASRASKGGNGGSVSKLNFTADGTFGFAGFYGGSGGHAAGGTNGKGGTGGSLSSITYHALGGLYAPDFEAGNGGNGAGTGAGGNGGSLSKLTITQGDTQHDQDLFGGAGGTAAAGKGGNGGGITGLKLTAGTTGEDIDIRAGAGGGSLSGAGGNGGSIGGASTLTVGDISDRVRAEAGAGGASTNGKGGNGGSLTSFTASLADTGVNGAKFVGGAGGNGAKGGGTGGAASKTSLNLNGTSTGFVSIYSGAGGSATGGDTRGGNGGAISSITINKTAGAPEFISAFSGSGGSGGSGSGTGAGGNGGAVSKVTYHGLVAANFLYVGSGNGGDSSGDGARGGNGGTVSNIFLDARVAFSEAAVIYGGNGGIAGGEGGKGGNGGNVSALKFAAPNSLIRINNGPNLGNPTGGAGGTGPDSTGGKGGSVSGLSGELGNLVTIAQRGGSSDTAGGTGGSVTGVNLKVVSQFVQLLAGGVGGDALAGGTAGRGGSVSNIKLPATTAIGNFGAAFNVDPASTPDAANPGMGGIVAGKAGFNGMDFDITLNGSVTNVTAQKIAAIIAGNVYNTGGIFDGTQANALSTTNAVSRIGGLKVQIIGADTGAPGFTFTNNPASPSSDYELDQGDTAIDGLVIVLEGKGTFPIEPLRKIEVPVA